MSTSLKLAAGVVAVAAVGLELSLSGVVGGGDDSPEAVTAPPLPVRNMKTTSVAEPSSCVFGTFRATRTPGACWRPYADTSPFNVPIGAATTVNPKSDAIVDRLLGFGAPQNVVGGVADTAYDWAHPLYYARPSDPLYTVECTRDWGRCEIEGRKVRIPAAARAAGGGDAHMAVIDQVSRWEYDLWQVQSKPAGGGTIKIAWGGRTRIGTTGSNGLGSNATAAHFGLAAGIIRPAELAAGRIDHALFLVVKCTNGGYVWPAEGPGVGRTCSSMGLANTDAPAMGEHFYLAMTEAEIASLDVPGWKKTILHAARRYGMFVGDTGGDSWSLGTQSGSSFTSMGYEDPWVTLGKAWRLPTWKAPTGATHYVFGVKEGIDWSRLRVADPPRRGSS